MAEASDLKSEKCGFESHLEHSMIASIFHFILQTFPTDRLYAAGLFVEFMTIVAAIATTNMLLPVIFTWVLLSLALLVFVVLAHVWGK